MDAKIEVNEFVGLLRDLMKAVAVDSDTYGTYHEERQLEQFLVGTGLFYDKWERRRDQ